jgi:hypothetical protein
MVKGSGGGHLLGWVSGTAVSAPGAYPEHDGAGGGQGGEDRVGESTPEHRVAEDGPEVGEDRFAPDDLVADGVLHPRIGGQDEEGREHGAQAHHPDRGQVQPGGQAVAPAIGQRELAPGG